MTEFYSALMLARHVSELIKTLCVSCWTACILQDDTRSIQCQLPTNYTIWHPRSQQSSFCAVRASFIALSVFCPVSLPADLLNVNIQVRCAAPGVLTNLICVSRGQRGRRSGRWSEWRHNDASLSKSVIPILGHAYL